MALSIARLRIWLLVGATLLVLVIAGFLGYARYRTHRFIAGLPARLGVDIRRETNGYTYSQSVKGKTVMTLHASKAVEHQNGKRTLHDVSIILYGRNHDRMDRISGSEFEYDSASGVVRAVGEVHIDLEPPRHVSSDDTEPQQSHPKQATHSAQEREEDRRVIHVKTSGLVYLQKLGIAATDQNLDFQFSGITGHAIGAEYNSNTGVLILQSAVKANGMQHGTPVVLTASHAELERLNQRAVLTQANYVSPAESIRGDNAIVHLRSDGSPERIEADGNVVLKSSTAGNVTAPHADVLLNQAGHARNAHLFGGVRYDDVTGLREGRGQTSDAQIAFDLSGQPEKVVLTGAVHVHERARAAETAASPWSVRESTAQRMTFLLVDDGTGKHKELRNAEAVGAAHVTLISDAGTAASTTSELSGENLQGTFMGSGKSVRLSEIRGAGHTSLRRLGVQGAEETSSGDTLEATLRPGVKRTKSAKSIGAEEIVKAVQSGHVVMTSRPASKPGAATPSTIQARAELSVYDGDADHLTLTGHAQVAEETGTVYADRIVMEHASGNTTADGTVKATYQQPNATEPMHILADRAELFHATNQAIFYGTGDQRMAGKPARLWQGASQVEAPVIEFDQQKRSLNAYGSGLNSALPPVHAALVGRGTAEPGKASHLSVIRVASQTMVYSDLERQVDFNGDVKVEGSDGTLHARQAIAYLQSAPAAGSDASKKSPAKDARTGVLFGGSVERIVASGKIEIDQPGRRASGEQLVYTASDGMFVLTGIPSALPKLIDEEQGTVTGTTLTFHTGDDSVMVTGVNHSSERVHTVTQVKRK